MSPAELMVAANRAHAEGRFDDCESACRSVLAVLPNNVAALVLAGVAAIKKGDPESSIPRFERAARADPGCAPAYLWLSMAHRRLGHKAAALARAKEAAMLSPRDPMAHNQLGQCLLDVEDFRAAESSFLKALSRAPNVAVVHYGLGLALRGLKRNSEAISALRRSLRLDPSSSATMAALRQTLTVDGDAAGAVEVSRELQKREPGSAEANLSLARALLDDNRANEAEPYIRLAIDLEPDSAMGHSLFGSILQVKGQFRDAEEHFRKSIDLLPEQGSAYLALSMSRRTCESDAPLVERMKSLAENEKVSAYERSRLHYALGKALEDLAEYEGAMTHFDEANRITYELKFGSQPYDPKELDAYDRALQILDTDLFQRLRSGGSTSELPIFVVGMIRSGTTLAEQILSCHPLVGAAGEQRFWLEMGRAALSTSANGVEAPALRRLTAKYESILREIAPGKSRVVDKMPMNYQAIGLIHLGFPHAKIIHIRRHPVDTCLSIYATPNSSRLRWAHNKTHIVLAYLRYLRLMDQWRAALPDDAMLEVQYEELVGDPETTIRSMVGFCGLEWDNRCLRPEQNERSVVTPSVWQVRQPVYKSSVARWKKYEPWLGPFAQLTKT